MKKQLLEKKELINGYAYKFKGTDAVLDELSSFINKKERAVTFLFIVFQLAEKKAKHGYHSQVLKVLKNLLIQNLNFKIFYDSSKINITFYFSRSL